MARTQKAVPTPTEKKLAIANAKSTALAAKKEVSRLTRYGKLLSSGLTQKQRDLCKDFDAATTALKAERKAAFKAHTVNVQAADKALIAAQRHLLKVSPPKSTTIMK